MRRPRSATSSSLSCSVGKPACSSSSRTRCTPWMYRASRRASPSPTSRLVVDGSASVRRRLEKPGLDRLGLSQRELDAHALVRTLRETIGHLDGHVVNRPDSRFLELPGKTWTYLQRGTSQLSTRMRRTTLRRRPPAAPPSRAGERSAVGAAAQAAPRRRSQPQASSPRQRRPRKRLRASATVRGRSDVPFGPGDRRRSAVSRTATTRAPAGALTSMRRPRRRSGAPRDALGRT